MITLLSSAGLAICCILIFLYGAAQRYVLRKIKKEIEMQKTIFENNEERFREKNSEISRNIGDITNNLNIKKSEFETNSRFLTEQINGLILNKNYLEQECLKIKEFLSSADGKKELDAIRAQCLEAKNQLAQEKRDILAQRESFKTKKSGYEIFSMGYNKSIYIDDFKKSIVSAAFDYWANNPNITIELVIIAPRWSGLSWIRSEEKLWRGSSKESFKAFLYNSGYLYLSFDYPLQDGKNYIVVRVS
jgi:hypothetical protein